MNVFIYLVAKAAIERYRPSLSKVDYEAMKKELLMQIRDSSTIDEVQRMAEKQFRLWIELRM